ncbi:unnamed protein product [Eruca vesicaria subsp. sativa]|uniref:Uncharacterized protein n=1 Tax=Eruca vesicaria subsp. sativa TaxID=29727 RepID=A0ABC8M083_ERUVS|nr:unnamed protein product [Eruca vesicaria subsp. sativa]
MNIRSLGSSITNVQALAVAYDRSSAPKDCRVSGWLEDKDMESETRVHGRELDSVSVVMLDLKFHVEPIFSL